MAAREDLTVYIGIDPDVTKSGVATWFGKRFTALTTMRFFELTAYLEKRNLEAFATNSQCIVYIEAGWLNVISNYHKEQGAKQRERIAKNVGSNHAIGKLLAEYCELIGAPYHL